MEGRFTEELCICRLNHYGSPGFWLVSQERGWRRPVVAGAGVIIDDDNIVSGSVTGDLVAIDVPYSPIIPTNGGPVWTDAADAGFLTVNNGIVENDGTSKWEPEGTPIGEAGAYRTAGSSSVPSVKWIFNKTASGIDIRDGMIIHAVYATWNTRGVDGCTYQYTEGTNSGSIVRQTGGAGPQSDLVIRWYDSGGTGRNGAFERLFVGPIVVEGDDGFEVWATDNVGNAAHIDAVVIDTTFPPRGTLIQLY